MGCTHATRIACIDAYINANVGRQSEQALWRCASATWQKQVVEPARREGILIPTWDYRAIAAHYRLHTTNAIIGRTSMVQSLTAMRCQVESCLIRVENGERQLDKANAELCKQHPPPPVDTLHCATSLLRPCAVRRQF